MSTNRTNTGIHVTGGGMPHRTRVSSLEGTDAGGGRRRRRTGFFLVLVLLVAGLAGLIALGGCDGTARSDAETPSAGAAGTTGTAAAGGETAAAPGVPIGKITNVEVLTVEPSAFTATIDVTGTVKAMNDAVVSAEVEGPITRYLVELGAHVTKGQAIVQIDDSLLRPQVKQAEAAAALAQETYERRRQLWTEERVGSELSYLQAKHDADRLQAALDALRTRLDKTTIRAPFDGIFDQKYLDVGEMAAPGARVLRVIGADRLKVTGGVPERFARDVHTGTPARVTFDVLPGVVIDTPVQFAGTAIDAANRTFTVELHIDNPNGIVKPAMIADIELLRNERANVLVVPQSAVTRTAEGFQVFVVTEGATGPQATARPVRLGVSRANQVIVEDGLEPGDRVIVSGNVDDRDAVRVVDEDASGAAADPPMAARGDQS